MMINVNGRPVSTGASLDLLTRAVIISLFTWRRAGRDDDAPQIFGWWG
ncbi:TPA: phage GP46 family protein, partial [Escherichia coli]